MNKLLATLTLSFFVLFNFSIFSQESVEEDSTKSERVSYEIFSTPFKNYKFFNPKFYKHPSITIYSGMNQPNYSNASTNPNFKTQNFAALHIGKTEIKLRELKDGRKINYITKSGLFIGNYSSKWQTSDNSKTDAKMWRFGIDLSDNGYGYKLGGKNFLFFTHGNSLIWSKFDIDNLGTFQQPDSLRFARFSEQFRFGSSYHNGLSIVLFNSMSVDFRFERSIIFPGHKFWYWLGSAVIEGVSQGLLDEFVREIAYSSPYAAPIVNAVLKGALSYGLYELRKDKMNWPFKTEPPLFNDNFKIGLTFLF